MQPLGENSVARFAEREREDRTPDDAPIHKQHLVRAVAAPLAGTGNPSVHADSTYFQRLHGHKPP